MASHSLSSLSHSRAINPASSKRPSQSQLLRILSSLTLTYSRVEYCTWDVLWTYSGPFNALMILPHPFAALMHHMLGPVWVRQAERTCKSDSKLYGLISFFRSKLCDYRLVIDGLISRACQTSLCANRRGKDKAKGDRRTFCSNVARDQACPFGKGEKGPHIETVKLSHTGKRGLDHDLNYEWNEEMYTLLTHTAMQYISHSPGSHSPGSQARVEAVRFR